MAIRLPRGCRIIVLCTVLAATRAHANTCDGPSECCTAKLAHGADRHEVSLGVVLMGLSNLNERSGTWDADFYLYEEWPPAAGFTPQTELANEVARQSVQFDTTLLSDGKCQRSRRIRATLRTAYTCGGFRSISSSRSRSPTTNSWRPSWSTPTGRWRSASMTRRGRRSRAGNSRASRRSPRSARVPLGARRAGLRQRDRAGRGPPPRHVPLV
jgi:hypothetical protein